MAEMLKFLREQFKAGQTQPSEAPSLELATAMLLLETAHADGAVETAERTALQAALRGTFQLSAEAVDSLLQQAGELLSSSDGVYVFTRRLREAWPIERRIKLLTWLWAVVFADGRIDRYEESHLRQVADQLGLVHAEYLQAKQAAARQAGQDDLSIR